MKLPILNISMFRQGDVLIKTIDSLPSGLKIKADKILVYGESTGHAHRLSGGDVMTGRDGLMFLRVGMKAKVTHEEHNTISLKKGLYAVIRQREYTSKDMTRLVID